ncbi:hypothetical protein GQ53DRAFT_715311 [Thozetella sp. PMI_491]|nr:hypothetical protein GQ53DRAFT_715311 [Thozetella sp. PMI_491]
MGEPVIRKRNVSSRDRTGCVTCRARRLKCDEGKPGCNHCARLNLPCGGYGRRIVFKDQTDLFTQRILSNERTPPKGQGSRGVGAAVWRVTPSYHATQALQPPSCTKKQSHHAATLTLDPGQDVIAARESSGCQESPITQTCEDTRSLAIGLSSEDTRTSIHVPTSHSLGIRGATESLQPDAMTTAELLITQPCQSDQIAPFDAEGYSQDGLGGKKESLISGYQIMHRPPLVPPVLLRCTKFVEDIIYYHHLRDSSPYGLLSILSLTDVIETPYLDGAFFHAALALSALEISRSEAPSALRSKAALHSLDHFVTALGTIGKVNMTSEDSGVISEEMSLDHCKREKAISWLSTVLFLAQFELQRGQMRLWYMHSRAAIDFLSQHLSIVLKSGIGESLIRSFSRIAALLDIFDRTHSVQARLASSMVSTSLAQSLKTSPFPCDRLLFILPHVNQLEEEWRANHCPESYWEDQAKILRNELQNWRHDLDVREVPAFDDEDPLTSPHAPPSAQFDVRPFPIPQAAEPIRAATNFMHYLVSMLRIDFMVPSVAGRKLESDHFADVIYKVCRLAAGVPSVLGAAVNAYGHGMIPALMNAYCLAEDTRVKNWMRNWIAQFPRDREGIWNVRRMQKLLAYIDEEYSLHGLRSGWNVIKARMVDLEEEGTTSFPESGISESDRFRVEIYAKGKNGWSIDFVEIN